MLLAERFKGEDLAAAQQRTVDCEERILGRGADEQYAALLNIGQKNVLLGTIEPV